MSGFRIKESFTVKGGEGQVGRIGDREFGMRIGGGVRVIVTGEGEGGLVSEGIGGGVHDMQDGSYGTAFVQRIKLLL